MKRGFKTARVVRKEERVSRNQLRRREKMDERTDERTQSKRDDDGWVYGDGEN